MTEKRPAYFIIPAVLVIAAVGIGVLGIWEIHSVFDDAVHLKANERDAYWTAKIEKSQRRHEQAHCRIGSRSP